MKKIFAISVLSLLAVVAGGDCAFAVRSEPFFTAGRIDQEIRRATNGMLTQKNIINSNETTTSPDYNAPSVLRMENTVNAAVATKVDNTQVVQKNATVTSADTQIPTIARMENYVDSEISAKVGTSQVITSSGTDLGGNQVADSVSSDAVVPTLKTVEENFAPRIGDVVYSGAPGGMDSTVDEIGVTNLPRGEYSVIVSVDGSGKATFRWVPIQIDSCSATDGGTCGPV